MSLPSLSVSPVDYEYISFVAIGACKYLTNHQKQEMLQCNDTLYRLRQAHMWLQHESRGMLAGYLHPVTRLLQDIRTGLTAGLTMFTAGDTHEPEEEEWITVGPPTNDRDSEHSDSGDEDDSDSDIQAQEREMEG